MFNRFYVHIIYTLILAPIVYFFCSPLLLNANFSTLAKNDPFPLFESLDPHTYLQTKEKLYFIDEYLEKNKRDWFTFSLSPFAQNANHGRTIAGEPRLTTQADGTVQNVYTQLGDLTGKTNLIALTYGYAPQDQTLADASPLLESARQAIFVTGQTPSLLNTNGTINDGRYIDSTQQFGTVSFPLKYRKRGIRFNFEGLLGYGFGASVQTGIASISQVPLKPIIGTTTGLFPTDCTPQIDACAVNNTLGDELDNILQDLDLQLEKCSRTSIEEIRLNLYWRNSIEFNKNKIEWPYYLLIPFAQTMVSISPGKEINPRHLFETPFGNNKHTAVGFKAGLNFDFVDTIEIGGEVGNTYFFKHNFDNVHLPTNEFQRNIFPFSANVNIKPGTNWHFAGKISAYHFLHNLSMYFQYVMIEHKEDRVTLRQCPADKAFDLESYQENTCFKVKLANIGFNYDISPNSSLGFLWQAPLSQRNAYESTTLLFTFNATF